MHTPFSARPLLRATAVAALWLTAGAGAHAQLHADASRITQVKV